MSKDDEKREPDTRFFASIMEGMDENLQTQIGLLFLKRFESFKNVLLNTGEQDKFLSNMLDVLRDDNKSFVERLLVVHYFCTSTNEYYMDMMAIHDENNVEVSKLIAEIVKSIGVMHHNFGELDDEQRKLFIGKLIEIARHDKLPFHHKVILLSQLCLFPVDVARYLYKPLLKTPDGIQES